MSGVMFEKKVLVQMQDARWARSIAETSLIEGKRDVAAKAASAWMEKITTIQRMMKV